MVYLQVVGIIVSYLNSVTLLICDYYTFCLLLI